VRNRNQILFQIRVLDVDDPLMLGRIRGVRSIDNYEDIVKSISSPTWNPKTDIWTERDPFIFNPLLPYFFYQVPKKDELVQCIYVNKEFTYENQYYIQNTFSTPTATNFQYLEGGNKFTGTGNQIKAPKVLKNKNGTYTDSAQHKGVFPEPNDNAVLGRGSADLIVKENEVLLRAGKFIPQKLQPNVLPTANQQRAFFQLSKFDSFSEKSEPIKIGELEEKIVLVKHLIEWSIVNPENEVDLFSGSVYLYKLKPDITTNSNNVSIGSNISNDLKFLIHSESFTLKSKDQVIRIINDFIKSCNNNLYSKSGFPMFSSESEKFPIFYRPNKLMYSFMKPSQSLGKYKSVGIKTCSLGSCDLNIKIIDTQTSDIVINITKKGVESMLEPTYDLLIDSVIKELELKNIGLVRLPELSQFDNVDLSISLEMKDIISSNLNYISNRIKLNEGLKEGGSGLIISQGKVGKPLDIVKKDLIQVKVNERSITYGSVGAEKLFLLSHSSSIPGKGKINFDDTLYGISPEQYSTEILPKTSSLVRGEELIELLNLIVRYLISHTHAYPGLPPIPKTDEGVSYVEILEQLQFANNKILNKNIRIN
jgi:hypothetical protein